MTILNNAVRKSENEPAKRLYTFKAINISVLLTKAEVSQLQVEAAKARIEGELEDMERVKLVLARLSEIGAELAQLRGYLPEDFRCREMYDASISVAEARRFIDGEMKGQI